MQIDEADYTQSKADELSDQEFGYINLEPLYEHSLKIFGDVFESLIGAVFLDSRSISKTESILYSLLKPFLKTHKNVETLDDHSRTKLLELWNSKPYSRHFKIKHEV
jgi:dsRNA-specific ribonuclease